MVSVSRYGREMSSVFDLLGTHEPALTAALGWTMGRSRALMSRVLDRVGLSGSTNADDVAVQLETANDPGRTDIELFTPTAHVIIEATQGWDSAWRSPAWRLCASLDAARTAGLGTRVVTLSDSAAAWAREVLPPDVAGVAGVEVAHWSWARYATAFRPPEPRQAAPNGYGSTRRAQSASVRGVDGGGPFTQSGQIWRPGTRSSIV